MKQRSFYEPDNYYPSMVDLMAGILFIMIILLMGFVIEEKAEKQQEAQIQLESKATLIKKSLLESLSDFLDKQGIDNYMVPEEGGLVIPASDLFIAQSLNLTEEANELAKILSDAIVYTLSETKEGQQSLADGLLSYIQAEIHQQPKAVSAADQNLLPWGRTIAFYGALLTAEKNSEKNRLMQYKNEKAEPIVRVEPFVNQGTRYAEHNDGAEAEFVVLRIGVR